LEPKNYMVGKLFVTATGKAQPNEPPFLADGEIVDSPRRAGRTRALTLIRGSDFTAAVRGGQEPAQRVPNNWRTTGRSMSGNKRNVRRLMLSRQSVRASHWSAHHHARAMISE
jgi:hypothetical protein